MEKKGKKISSIHIYAGSLFRRKLMELAARNKRSLSSEIQALVEEAYRKQIEVIDAENHDS